MAGESIINLDEVYKRMQAGATLIADESKLRAWIHENGQLKVKIKYSIYLELFNLSVLNMADHESPEHIFYYHCKPQLGTNLQ